MGFFRSRGLRLALALGLLVGAAWTLFAADPKEKEVWTDPADPTLPADVKVQGEYVGEIPRGGKIGCQIIALGKGTFQAVLFPGGLPGDGWDGEHKILMDGKIEGSTPTFGPATGKKKYLAKAPAYLALPNVVTIGGSWVAPKDAIAAGDFGRVTTLAREAAGLRR